MRHVRTLRFPDLSYVLLVPIDTDRNSMTARETPVITPATGVLVKQDHGGAIMRGGTNPGSGRPTNEFRHALRDILTMPEVHAAFMAIITDPSHNQFTSLWKSAAAYAYGRPPQTVKLESDTRRSEPLTHERLARDWERLQRIQSIEALEKMLTEPKQIVDPSD